jgi:N6-L-threonylcarbamoyladenine synthase
MNILAIETSFDETAAAVVKDGTRVLSSVLATSSALHKQFGGVLPELAARKQLDFIVPVLSHIVKDHPLDTIDALAVTIGPGLIGSLLVGVEAAKTIAFVTKKPIIPVNHVHAHVYANFINSQRPTANGQQPTANSQRIFPAISLVVSGGHTELFFMKNEKSLQWISGTIDDAAGEAFDKTARLLGLENPGGIAIEEAAKTHSHKPGTISFQLPRPLLHDNSLNFSFSGLKTAVLRAFKQYSSQKTVDKQQLRALFAYEIQEAITDVLVAKTIKAAEQHNAQSIFVSGGVAANERLREKFHEKLSTVNRNLSAYFPSKALCTDNAIMIGSAAYFLGKPQDWHTIAAIPNLPVEL